MKKIKHSKIFSTKKLNINHALINIILNIDIHIKPFFHPEAKYYCLF